MKNASERYVRSIEELGRLYDYLNREFYESALSKPVITIMPEEGKRKDSRILGWFTEYEVWNEKNGERAYELNITADYADRSWYEIAETLLHEMAHQYARENNIDDCSREGTYHNKHFSEIASNHGLTVTKTKKYGYSETTLTSDAQERVEQFKFEEELIYRRQTLDMGELIQLIEKQVPQDAPNREALIQDLVRGVFEGKMKITKNGVKPKRCSTRKYVCPTCGMSVRATREVNIKCGDCDIQMIVASREEDSADNTNQTDNIQGGNGDEQTLETSA